jgi:hypothetical protein
MKREAIGHTKMKRLCRYLDIPHYQAVGIMESIWQLCARECPRGDLGRLSDDDIALAIDYRGNEQALVEALIRSEWLDVSPESRFVVHDWATHCEDSVHTKLARAGETFHDGTIPSMARMSERERATCAQKYQTCAQNTDPSARRAHAVRTNGQFERPTSTSTSTSTPPLPEETSLRSVGDSGESLNPPAAKPLAATAAAGAGANGNNRAPTLPGFEHEPEPAPQRKPKKPVTKGHPLSATRAAGWSRADITRAFAEQFWPAVWAKIGRDASLRAWFKRVTTQADAERITAAAVAQGPRLMAQAVARAAQEGGGELRPLHPATWLNAGRFEDELLPEIRPIARLPSRPTDKAAEVRRCFDEQVGRALANGEFTRRS